MPDLGNLVIAQSPAELKPFLHQTPMSPNPTRIQEPEAEEFEMEPQLTKPYVDDGKQESNSSKGFEPELKLSDEGEAIKRGLERCGGVEKLANERGIEQFKCSFPFLVGAPKLVQCGVCQNVVYPEEAVLCSVRGCHGKFHKTCVKGSTGFSFSKQFKCPQHACFLCKQKYHLWRCIRCPIACHDKCAPFPEHVFHFPDRPGEAICWKHATDWRLEKVEVPATRIEDVFSLLPLPYNEEEFTIDINWKDQTETKLEPTPYVQIKRNVYLVKRKRNNVDTDTGCNCSSTQCSEGCVCRVQCISCSKACRCSEKCTNRPFRKNKKIQIVKTELCGWGVVAAESISKGDFIVEYVGEVIDDAMCESRLWDMKDEDAQNFYMCEINKDFVIDATFKGNASRFLNHSCSPNCKLEKWQVEGETRVGVFASRSIDVGEPLTYDYRFIQFGPEVKCHCGASNCQGYLGTQRKALFGAKTKSKVLDISWGPKRRRTTARNVGIIIN